MNAHYLQQSVLLILCHLNTLVNGLFLIADVLLVLISVEIIAEYAFSGCSSLTSINLPSSVEMIGKEAFKNCKSLVSIDIPSSDKRIEKNTFLLLPITHFH